MSDFQVTLLSLCPLWLQEIFGIVNVNDAVNSGIHAAVTVIVGLTINHFYVKFFPHQDKKDKPNNNHQ